ncbi:MAG: hypothetical protein JNM19_14285 [Chitinophagaceae bacterium]|nr:hypothetical protein [Chitinophagaceae bacterium]
MGFNRLTDFSLNVVLPLLFGCAIYFFGRNGGLAPVLKNHAADGLWAYAFISALLIIWHRSLPLYWLLIACFVAVLFECLQYKGFVEGVGDWTDAAVYLVFILLGYLLNNTFKRLYLTAKQNKLI